MIVAVVSGAMCDTGHRYVSPTSTRPPQTRDIQEIGIQLPNRQCFILFVNEDGIAVNAVEVECP